MTDFQYQEMFPLEKDATEYRLISNDFIDTATFDGHDLVKIDPQALTLLAEEAFKDVSHLLRPAHLEKVAAILKDPEASENDRLVALEMLKNAVISAEGEFPMCQDTGTAIIIGKKGQQIWTGHQDEAALAQGVHQAYQNNNLRYSQNAPLSMYEEKNTGNNLPAQIELYATQGDAYHFLFIAKGGGSANKSYLFQETKALLNPETLMAFMRDKMKMLGTAACPPYHLAFVIGGTSAEFNLKTVKLASARYLDALPTSGSESGHGFRDRELEERTRPCLYHQIGRCAAPCVDLIDETAYGALVDEAVAHEQAAYSHLLEMRAREYQIQRSQQQQAGEQQQDAVARTVLNNAPPVWSSNDLVANNTGTTGLLGTAENLFKGGLAAGGVLTASALFAVTMTAVLQALPMVQALLLLPGPVQRLPPSPQFREQLGHHSEVEPCSPSRRSLLFPLRFPSR